MSNFVIKLAMKGIRLVCVLCRSPSSYPFTMLRHFEKLYGGVIFQ